MSTDRAAFGKYVVLRVRDFADPRVAIDAIDALGGKPLTPAFVVTYHRDRNALAGLRAYAETVRADMPELADLLDAEIDAALAEGPDFGRPPRRRSSGGIAAVQAPTDGAPAVRVLEAVRTAAQACEPRARVLGTIRAGDIAAATAVVLARVASVEEYDTTAAALGAALETARARIAVLRAALYGADRPHRAACAASDRRAECTCGAVAALADD